MYEIFAGILKANCIEWLKELLIAVNNSDDIKMLVVAVIRNTIL